MNSKVNGFFSNMVERGWALLNEHGKIKRDCYNCNKYSDCQQRKLDPCAEYEMLKMVRPGME